MSSWDMASRSLPRRKLRTGLTVSGIVVGVSLIIIILSVAAGFDQQPGTFIRALSGADMTVVTRTVTSGGPEGRFGFLASSQ